MILNENLIKVLHFVEKFIKLYQRNKKLFNFKVGPFYEWTVLKRKIFFFFLYGGSFF